MSSKRRAVTSRGLSRLRVEMLSSTAKCFVFMCFLRPCELDTVINTHVDRGACGCSAVNCLFCTNVFLSDNRYKQR